MCVGVKYTSHEGASTYMECDDGKNSEGVGSFRYSVVKYSSTTSVFYRVCEKTVRVTQVTVTTHTEDHVHRVQQSSKKKIGNRRIH